MIPLFTLRTLAPITQYQDLGRFGHLHQGFSVSGPMDEAAFRLNNALLGNDDNAVQLEIAPGGLVLDACADCVIAIAGAYLKPMLNRKPLVNFNAVQIRQGDELKFGFSKRGLYAYLAVKGGFFVPKFLGSAATTARLQVFPDAPLAVGHTLRGQGYLAEPQQLTGVARAHIPDYGNRVIDVLSAYQFAQFSSAARQRFTQQAFTVHATDRMGTRLSAEHPIAWTGEELLSEGIVPGAIQIPPDGQPIVLQKDAQSLGGYPKIGVIPSDSRSRLAQLPVGQQVYFRFFPHT